MPRFWEVHHHGFMTDTTRAEARLAAIAQRYAAKPASTHVSIALSIPNLGWQWQWRDPSTPPRTSSRAMSPFQSPREFIGHSGASGAVAFHVPVQGLYVAAYVGQVKQRSLVYQLMAHLANRAPQA
jgi:hypothetical protein